MESSTHKLNYTEYRYGLLYDSILTTWFNLSDPVTVKEADGTVHHLRIHTMRPRIDGLTSWHRKNNNEIGDTVRIERTGKDEISISVIERASKNQTGLTINLNTTTTTAKVMEDFISGNVEQETLVRAIELIDHAMSKISPKKVRRTVQQSIRNDTRIIQLLKQIRKYACQFPGCKATVIKKDGTNYVEVAHIKPVHTGGRSVIGNLLVLCPNHHKEFDLGALIIDKQNVNLLSGTLNGKEFNIDLTF